MHLMVAGSAGASPAGMNKSGTQLISATTSDVKVVGWAVRAGYEESSIVSNELVVTDDVSAIIRCQISLTATWSPFTGSLQVSIMRNATVLTTASFTSGTATLSLPDLALELSGGDRVWAQMTNTTSTPYSRDATLQTGSGTYLSIDLA
ncbi:hypothetical protein [Nocardia rhizosphaerae]|uniref:Uncharacterized protein n=1 Tax=Nocardia rhizosphaerae TaxID=1691571 RepID=A0ABV8KZH5_9NOCA